MADETTPNPFGAMTVLEWTPATPDVPLNAVAAPPATSVAGTPEPAVPEPAEPDDAPPDEEGPDPGTPPTEEEEPVEASEGAAPDKQTRFNRRFSDLTRETREAQLAQARAEGRAEALQEAFNTYLRGQQDAPGAAAPPVDDGLKRTAEGQVLRPREYDYPTTEAYYEALDRFDTVQGEANYQAWRARSEQEARDAAVRARYPDFDRAMAQAKTVRIPDVVAPFIQHSPVNQDLIYVLATDPAKAQALAQITDRDAALAAIQALEAPFRTAAVPAVPGAPVLPPEVLPPAPLPLTPTRAAGARAPVDLEKMPMMDFLRQRDKEERAHRR